MRLIRNCESCCYLTACGYAPSSCSRLSSLQLFALLRGLTTQCHRFTQLESNSGISGEELVELVEATYEAFDDVWKCTDVNEVYPQVRLAKLQ